MDDDALASDFAAVAMDVLGDTLYREPQDGMPQVTNWTPGQTDNQSVWTLADGRRVVGTFEVISAQ